ncbi:hypothetical protein EV176_002045 [Coemansia sp. RSA 451]|nr:hypothetical protein EV176_002045 [Coemansia sp. RSA 451]
MTMYYDQSRCISPTLSDEESCCMSPAMSDDESRCSTPELERPRRVLPIPNNLPRRIPMTLNDYAVALKSIQDPLAHAEAVFNGQFEWGVVTPLSLVPDLVTAKQIDGMYVGIDVDSVIIPTNDLSFLQGAAKLQLVHTFDGGMNSDNHVDCCVPPGMRPKHIHQTVNAFFADFGLDTRLNIVFPHLPDAADKNKRRNYLNKSEMVDFYENLLYKAARMALPVSSHQRVPVSHEVAMNKCRTEQGQSGKLPMPVQVDSLIEIVKNMRHILDELSEEVYMEDEFATSTYGRFRDFSFLLTIKGMKDACQVPFEFGNPTVSVDKLLRNATLFIDWDRAHEVAKQVVVDYGLEIVPVGEQKPATLAWYLPNLKPIVKAHGMVKSDDDLYCHLYDRGGLRAALTGDLAQGIGGLSCQFYLGEKSLAYNYNLGHNKKKFRDEHIFKCSKVFKNLLKRSNLVADKAVDLNLGVRAEYRLTWRTDAELVAFMCDLVKSIKDNMAIVTFSSAAIFGLKRERNRAVAYVAEKLNKAVWGPVAATRHINVALYIRYIFLGTLSRPDDYSTTRRLVRDYQVNTNIKHLGLPVADWLSVEHLYLNITSPYATLPGGLDLDRPDNFGAPTPELVADELYDVQERRRACKHGYRVDSNNSTNYLAVDTRHMARNAAIPTNPYEPQLPVEEPVEQAIDTRHMARLAVVPTCPTLQQPADMAEEEEDEQPPQLAAIPVLQVDRAALIEAKANTIFGQFKYNIGGKIPKFEETCYATKEYVASMEWTEENWRAVIMPIVEPTFQTDADARLSWIGRFVIFFGKATGYSPKEGRCRRWNNVKYLAVLTNEYRLLKNNHERDFLRYHLWELFKTLQVVPKSTLKSHVWVKANGVITFASQD